MNQEDKNDIIDRRKKCAVKLICFTRFSNCDSFIEIKLLALLCMAVFAETKLEIRLRGSPIWSRDR
jgi:hypothetical protein